MPLMKQITQKVPSVAPLFLALGILGCGNGDSGGGSEQNAQGATDEDAADSESSGSGSKANSRRSRTPDAERIGTEDYESEQSGALYGEIRTKKGDVERFPIGARQKSECKHHADVEHLSDVLLVKNGRIQNAFVYIKSGYDKDGIPPAPSSSVTLDQKGCLYTPHVLALRTGQELRVANSDPTNHNVNIISRRNEGGNRNMGRGQAPVAYSFPRPEVGIRFKCDIHPWMGARVHVSEHPWFAITDAAGKFRIPDVPPGKYIVEVVHEDLGKTRGTVTVEAGKASGFTLSLDG